jgi:tRNA (mo5U34)-methyltransferase
VAAEEVSTQVATDDVSALTWYHTIELPGGVVTPGEYDTRAALARIPFPADLSGKRCLDVGTHDGFWAFEMERRGAAEVVAIDLDDFRQVDFSEPRPEFTAQQTADREARPSAFRFAHRALQSRVDRRDLSVYRLAAADLGQFDFAFIGTLLLHLRDPVLALTNIGKVLKPGSGRFLVNDAILLGMTLRHPRRPVHELQNFPGRPFWWVGNLKGLERSVAKAGFEVTGSGGPYLLPNGPGYNRPPHEARTPIGRAIKNRGMVHGWVSALWPVQVPARI